jgi:hypothetical protein
MKILFLNKSFEERGLILQSHTKLNMFCIGILLNFEDCKGGFVLYLSICGTYETDICLNVCT